MESCFWNAFVGCAESCEISDATTFNLQTWLLLSSCPTTWGDTTTAAGALTGAFGPTTRSFDVVIPCVAVLRESRPACIGAHHVCEGYTHAQRIVQVVINMTNEVPMQDVGWTPAANLISLSNCGIYSGGELVKSLVPSPRSGSFVFESAPDPASSAFDSAQIQMDLVLNEDDGDPGPDLGVHDGELRFTMTLDESVSSGSDLSVGAYAAYLAGLCWN